jgi:hypothetical protein
MEEFTYDENYGDLRFDTAALIRKHNVSPADWLLLEIHFRNDWDRINRFILDNVKGIRRNFYYPFGGMA